MVLEVPRNPLNLSGFFVFITTWRMHQLYILYSPSSAKFYIGETHNINERILKHNQHSYTNSFTKIANDWELVLLFNCQNKEEAVFLENFIKRMKSKIFIKKVIANPSILEDVLSKK